MAFLNRIFRNRGLLENLGREPLAPILEPIAPRPIATPFVPTQPVLPFPERLPDPFERLPLENPRDDFLSIQRLDDRPQPQIIPPVTPLPVIPPQPPSIGGIGGINQDPRPLERPIIPPKRNDFISINRVNSDDLRQRQALGLTAVPGVGSNNFGGTPLVKGPAAPQEQTGLTAAELLELSDEELRKYIPRKTISNMYTSYDATPSPEEFRKQLQRELNPSPDDLKMQLGGPRRYNLLYENPIVGRRPPRAINRDLIVPISPPPTPEPVIEPAPTTPAAVATDVGAVPVTTIPEDVRGQVDPVLTQQDTRELQTDPLLRALYFGTADQPGFINQLQQATANLIASDVPLQETAGLSELEQIAQDRALADLGVAEPFVGESADLIRGTTRQFDPSMTQQFFNPFEDQVVQQTIQDVLEAGEKRDIAQRARDIQTGGLSAFGSRARLTAADRQEALGRGLAEALGGIRQAGFSQAQRDAMTTFDRQRLAEQEAATGLGQIGIQLADLRERERASLAGLGQTGRGIEETGLSRLFQQQLDQQGRPLQALQLTGQLLPQFQAGTTQIDSQYRLPADPSALGLGAAFSAYTSLKPPTSQAG